MDRLKVEEAWVNPTDLDLDGIARPRNVHIIGNKCDGNYPQDIYQAGKEEDLVGPFYVSDNVANNYDWYSNTYCEPNNVATPKDNAPVYHRCPHSLEYKKTGRVHV